MKLFSLKPSFHFIYFLNFRFSFNLFTYLCSMLFSSCRHKQVNILSVFVTCCLTLSNDFYYFSYSDISLLSFPTIRNLNVFSFSMIIYNFFLISLLFFTLDFHSFTSMFFFLNVFVIMNILFFPFILYIIILFPFSSFIFFFSFLFHY